MKDAILPPEKEILHYNVVTFFGFFVTEYFLPKNKARNKLWPDAEQRSIIG